MRLLTALLYEVVKALFSDWLHAGEQDAVGIYRRPWILIACCSGAITLAVALVFSSLSVGLANVAVLLLLVGFGTLSWRRQAAILTPTAVLFRPLLGKPREFSLHGVKRVSRTERSSADGWIGVCRLEFLAGGFFEIPWGYVGDLAGGLERLIAPPAHSRG